MACDKVYNGNNLIDVMFQSTHAHGVRPEGGNTNLATAVVSIHARTWRATLFNPSKSFVIFGFNPRTHMACD